jgi:hypothetical protein
LIATRFAVDEQPVVTATEDMVFKLPRGLEQAAA